MTNIELIEAAIDENTGNIKTLSLPGNVKFGLEIEMEELSFEVTERRVQIIDEELKCEGDLSLKKGGVEVVVPPLCNTKNNLLILKKLAKSLSDLRPHFNNCSFQINFDDNYTTEQRIDFMKLYSFYEDVIYRFSSGVNRELRESIEVYAFPIYYDFAELLSKYPDNPEMVLKNFSNKKLFGINLKNKTKPNLIEFRTPNGTTNYHLWLNYINTFYYLMNAVKEANYDKELVDYFIKNFIEFNNDYEEFFPYGPYYNLNIEKGLQFANLIFDDDYDKIHFLKQYIKRDQDEAKQYILH